MNLKSKVLYFFNIEFNILLPVIVFVISACIAFDPCFSYYKVYILFFFISLSILYVIFAFLNTICTNNFIHKFQKILLIFVYVLVLLNFTYNIIRLIKHERAAQIKDHLEAQEFKKLYQKAPDRVGAFIKEHPEHSEKYKKLNI